MASSNKGWIPGGFLGCGVLVIYFKFHTSCHFTAAEAMVQEDTALVVASIRSRTTLHSLWPAYGPGRPCTLCCQHTVQDDPVPVVASIRSRAILYLLWSAYGPGRPCTCCSQHTVQDDPALVVARINIPRSMGGEHLIWLHCTPTRPSLYLYQASFGAPKVHP